MILTVDSSIALLTRCLLPALRLTTALCGADVDVFQVSGDGRCLFRSLVTAMDSKLQTADRDEHGVLASLILEMCEQNCADEL